MPIPPDDIAQWRIKVFTTILPIVVELGFVAALPSIPLLISKGKWPFIVMDVVALAWLLAQDESIVPIPGARTLAHLEENVTAASIVLAPSELAAIAAAIPAAVHGARYPQQELDMVGL